MSKGWDGPSVNHVGFGLDDWGDRQMVVMVRVC